MLFFLLGLGGGSVYAILGLGLVLKYRSAGVVDFAQGAVAMYGAYVFIGLRTSGLLQLPWIILPHQITLSSHGLPAVWALLITLVYGAVLGVVLYQLVYRPLLRAAPLTKVCASVGRDALPGSDRGAQLRDHAHVGPVGAAHRELPAGLYYHWS